MIETFDKFLFRCSALGNVVTASGELTQAAKTYLLDTFIGEVQGVKKEAYGKQIDKGVACEPDGFKMLNDVLYPGRYIVKETEPKTNEWIKGTADAIPDDFVNDIKNAYDRFTFGKADLNHIYKTQLEGYMMLYGKPKARLFYALINLPEFLVDKEEKKMFYTQNKWTSFEDPDYEKACHELREAHKYDNLQLWERFKVWEFDHKPEMDEKIKDCVSQGRKYMNKLLKEYKDQIEYNRSLTEKALFATL